jgi:hypothetical protein
MALGLSRPKSKLPNPSTNLKFSNHQDYMAEAMNSPSAKKEKKSKNIGEYATGHTSGESV